MHAALQAITVRFGEHVAVDQVSMAFRPGTVHAIVGENGAGKSTAMNVLFGLRQPDAGQIVIDDQVCRFPSPQAAIAAGLGMVHQHFMLVDTMTVLENLVLCVEPDAGAGFIDFDQARAQLQSLTQAHGIAVDPDARVNTLSFGERQRVEIVRVLFRNAQLLVLDEPTAVLTPQERDGLFDIMSQLREQGRTLVLITHKLDEVMTIADEVSVMRQGKVVFHATLDQRGASENSSAHTAVRQRIAEEIVGGAMPPPLQRDAGAPGKTVLSLSDVRCFEGALPVGSVSLTLQQHEIVGIAGVAGNGQSALVRAIVGLESVHSGDITLCECNITAMDVAAHRQAGLCYIPEDRQSAGLALGASVFENAAVAQYDKFGFHKGPFLLRRALRTFALTLINRFRVAAPSPAARVSTLSGGNQQKLVVGRELTSAAPLIVAENPTWGVDIGAIDFIHRQLIKLRDEGHAVLLVSSELDEILALADRVLVMSGGRLIGELPRASANRSRVGALMMGSRPSERNAA